MSNSFPDGNQGEEKEFHPPTHHPSAPAHEVFDISTTVDPSYVISLIRKLLPSDVKIGENAFTSGFFCEKQNTEGVEKENGIDENGGENEAMNTENNVEVGGSEVADNHNRGPSDGEQWEDCGCILWDLSASQDQAQFMVQNLVLEVLMANLMVSQSSRLTEISLGIIGNLACHEIPRKQIATTNGLVRSIVDKLLLDDVPCLCEVCRVLALCLQGGEGVVWAEALEIEQIISRILWIAENALNFLLIERVVGLLLAVVESQHEVSAILLPPMMKLNLPSLLINLLAFEMNKFISVRLSERYPLLDLILRTVESLSVIDDYSREICTNKELFQLLKEFIKLPNKDEILDSCVTAVVLAANILTDTNDIASDLSKDPDFLEGLFDMIRLSSNYIETENAIWSIFARILTVSQEIDMSPSTLHIIVSVLTNNLDIIEDELILPQLGLDEDNTTAHFGATRVIIMKRISDISRAWKSLDDEAKNSISMEDYGIIEEDVDKLLSHCSKASM